MLSWQFVFLLPTDVFGKIAAHQVKLVILSSEVQSLSPWVETKSKKLNLRKHVYNLASGRRPSPIQTVLYTISM